jgi:prepilin-type N-terminal cleavage/methylation domain-containing protein
MLKFPAKGLDSASGFTLIEVLVGMLIATIFVAVTMQSMVLGSLFKARARQYSEGVTWIQQDLEQLKYQAATYKSTALAVPATRNTANNATTVDIEVKSADDFAVGDKLRIGPEADIYTISSKSGNTLTITPNLRTDRAIDTRVVEVSKCGDANTPATITTGFADGLRDRYIGSNSNATSQTIDTNKNSQLKQTKIGGNSPTVESGQQQFTVKKIVTLADVEPFNLLQIKYEVRPSDNPTSDPVAEIYTEIVPNAAFACSL